MDCTFHLVTVHRHGLKIDLHTALMILADSEVGHAAITLGLAMCIVSLRNHFETVGCGRGSRTRMTPSNLWTSVKQLWFTFPTINESFAMESAHS